MHDFITHARFYAKTSADPKTGCVLWTAATEGSGYGIMMVGSRRTSRKVRKAHQLSWEIHRGPIPAGMCVLHTCDVRRCVSPNHLFLGAADNTEDMFRKNRHTHRLSDHDVSEILRRHAGGESRKALGAEYSVHPGHIWIW